MAAVFSLMQGQAGQGTVAGRGRRAGAAIGGVHDRCDDRAVRLATAPRAGALITADAFDVPVEFGLARLLIDLEAFAAGASRQCQWWRSSREGALVGSKPSFGRAYHAVCAGPSPPPAARSGASPILTATSNSTACASRRRAGSGRRRSRRRSGCRSTISRRKGRWGRAGSTRRRCSAAIMTGRQSRSIWSIGAIRRDASSSGGTLGEVLRGARASPAEIRGLTYKLGMIRGRIFQHACDAVLGDRRCRVMLDDPRYRAEEQRSGGDQPAQLHERRARRLADQWFARGTPSWHDGGTAIVKSSGRRSSHAVAGSARPNRGRRPVPHHRRLRQEFCHLPPQVRQCEQLPRAFPQMPGNDALF